MTPTADNPIWVEGSPLALLDENTVTHMLTFLPAIPELLRSVPLVSRQLHAACGRDSLWRKVSPGRIPGLGAPPAYHGVPGVPAAAGGEGGCYPGHTTR